MNKILTYVVQLILVSVLVFGLHYIFQQVLGVLGNWENTGYSLHLIYLFELIISISPNKSNMKGFKPKLTSTE